MGILNDLKRYSILIRKLNKISDNLKLLGKREYIKKFELVKNNTDFKKITMPKENKLVFNNKRIFSIEFIPSIDNYNKLIISDESNEVSIEYTIEIDGIYLTEKKKTLSKLNECLQETVDIKEYKCEFLTKEVIEFTDSRDQINRKTFEEILYDEDNKKLLKRICNETEDLVMGINGAFNIPFRDTVNKSYYKSFNEVFENNNVYINYDIDKFISLSNNYSKKLIKKPTK